MLVFKHSILYLHLIVTFDAKDHKQKQYCSERIEQRNYPYATGIFSPSLVSFGTEYLFYYLWITNVLCFGSNAADEMLLLEMHIEEYYD